MASRVASDRLAGGGLWRRGRSEFLGWVMAVMAVMGGGVVGVVGVGTVHAQECDPIEVAEIFADDKTPEGDRFGSAIALRGDTVVVGVQFDENNEADQLTGSVSVFVRTDGVWLPRAKLVSGSTLRERFGCSVSLSGDTLAVGAYANDDNGETAGAVYVFVRNGSGEWSRQAKLLAADGETEDRFGYSVAVDGDNIVVGARTEDSRGNDAGAGYFFAREGGVWTQRAKVFARNRNIYANFGTSVSISGDTAVIGSPGGQNDERVESGTADVFVFRDGGWNREAMLTADDGGYADDFGKSVRIDGDTIMIGAPNDQVDGVRSGSAYVFRRTASVWTQVAKLLPADGGPKYALFGKRVSFDDDKAVVSAVADDDNGAISGSAYVFTRGDGEWAQQAKLLPADGSVRDGFGSDVAVYGDTVFVGAAADDDNGVNAGSMYLFDLRCNDCPADLDGDGEVNTDDFFAFYDAWLAGEPLADWDDNGVIDTRDFVAYLNDWVAGC